MRVDNIAGTIRVQPSNDGQVTIEATKRGGDAAERDRVMVEAKAQAQSVEARVCCGPCDGDSDNDCRGRVEVDFVVKVPGASRLAHQRRLDRRDRLGHRRGPRDHDRLGRRRGEGSRELRIKTVSGDAKVEGAVGLKLNTVSGDLKASNVRGETQFQSVSGDVDWRGACGVGCRIQAETTSGDLHLGVGPQGSFELEFESRSGDYQDDIGTTVSSRDRHPTRIRARAGKGEGRVEFQSVSGDLSLDPLARPEPLWNISSVGLMVSAGGHR